MAIILPMLCWVCCSTDPKAIRSLAGGPRAAENPSPRNARAKALLGVFEPSVKILSHTQSRRWHTRISTTTHRITHAQGGFINLSITGKSITTLHFVTWRKTCIGIERICLVLEWFLYYFIALFTCTSHTDGSFSKRPFSIKPHSLCNPGPKTRQSIYPRFRATKLNPISTVIPKQTKLLPNLSKFRLSRIYYSGFKITHENPDASYTSFVDGGRRKTITLRLHSFLYIGLKADSEERDR